MRGAASDSCGTQGVCISQLQHTWYLVHIIYYMCHTTYQVDHYVLPSSSTLFSIASTPLGADYLELVWKMLWKKKQKRKNPRKSYLQTLRDTINSCTRDTTTVVVPTAHRACYLRVGGV